MEQAVFFGDRSDVSRLVPQSAQTEGREQNPLSFDLPAGFRGDVAAAAEAVSAEILASSRSRSQSVCMLLTNRLTILAGPV